MSVQGPNGWRNNGAAQMRVCEQESDKERERERGV